MFPSHDLLTVVFSLGLDCFVYAFASFHGLNPNFKAIEFNLNKSRKEQETKNQTRPREKTIVRNNFINSWDK